MNANWLKHISALYLLLAPCVASAAEHRPNIQVAVAETPPPTLVVHDLTPLQDAMRVLINPHKELPPTLAAGGRVPLTLVMENRGVAPPYARYELRVKLSGAGGQVVKVLGAGGKSWLPGAPVASGYAFSLLQRPTN